MAKSTKQTAGPATPAKAADEEEPEPQIKLTVDPLARIAGGRHKKGAATAFTLDDLQPAMSKLSASESGAGGEWNQGK